MELVYLYAGRLGKCIDNTEINFSKNFKVTYDSPRRNLKIEKKNNPDRVNIYGNNIRDINVLVGKNGIGKSTFMRLLGLPEKDRNKYFRFLRLMKQKDSNRYNTNTWFAVYHLSGDIFAIEGYWVSLLENFLIDDPEVKPVYRIGIQYDFDNSRIVKTIPVGELDSKFDGDSLFYVYFQNNTGVRWFNEYAPEDRLDQLRKDFFPRLSCNASSYESVIKYLIDSRRETKFSARMGTKPGTKVEIGLNHIADPYNEDRYRSYNEDEGEERKRSMELISKRIYGNEDTLVMSFYNPGYLKEGAEITNKQCYIISYLETIVDAYLYDFLSEDEFEIIGYVTDTPYNASGEKDNYNSRKTYLLNVLEHAENYASPDNLVVPYIIKGLESIPDKYFENLYTISAPAGKLERGELDGLMQALDVDSMNIPIISQRSVLGVTFSEMSAGEAHFIDVFASINGALKARERLTSGEAKPGNDTCILLMDEPDMSFHPEWSRTFIDNLTYFLKNNYKNINFQVIITTHSPLMLSDIKSDSIYCLGKDEKGKLIVTNPEYGLLSGINDILIDGFFTESVFGKFAEKFANKIVQELSALENDISQNNITQYDFARKYSDLKDRIDILGNGLIKERLMQRLIMVRDWFEMRNGYGQN